MAVKNGKIVNPEGLEPTNTIRDKFSDRVVSNVKRRKRASEGTRQKWCKGPNTMTTFTDQAWDGVGDARTPELDQNNNIRLPASFVSSTAQSFRPTSARGSKRMSRRFSIPRRTSSLAASNKKSQRPDALTLHRQSCQLFSSLDGVLALSREFTPLPSPSTSRSTTRPASVSNEETRPASSFKSPSSNKATKRDSFQSPRTSIQVTYEQFLQIVSNPISPASKSSSRTSSSSISLQSSSTSVLADPETKSTEQTQQPQTLLTPPRTQSIVITWTSPTNRLVEYNKIDRAHSGLRGFTKRILPKSLKKRGWRNFFGGECDGDSVRRFRLDDDNEEAQDGEEYDMTMSGTNLENSKSLMDEKKELQPQVIEAETKPSDSEDDENDQENDGDSPCKGKRQGMIRHRTRRLSGGVAKLLNFSG